MTSRKQSQSNYNHDLAKLTDQYMSEHPDEPFTLYRLGKWMIENNHWKQQQEVALKRLS